MSDTLVPLAFLTPPASVTTTNTGRSDQKLAPGVRSNLGNPLFSGIPTQAASATELIS